MSGSLSALNSFASTDREQGAHKWVGLMVDTGEESIIGVSFYGTPLTETDVAEAALVGVGAGKFVLWIRADEIASASKTAELSKTGMQGATLTISFIDISGTEDTGGGGDGGSAAPAPETPASGNTAIATTTVSSSTDMATGKTTAAVTASAVEKLVDEAKAVESSGLGAIVEIKIETGASTTSAELTIPGDALSSIVRSTDADVKIDAGIGAITFSAAAAESISATAGTSDVSISIAVVDVSVPPDQAAGTGRQPPGLRLLLGGGQQ